MIWLLLYLATFSNSFLRPVLGRINIGLSGHGRQLVEENDILFATIDDFTIPKSHLTIDFQTPNWEGKTWHYTAHGQAGIPTDEFSVFIIDHDVSTDDPDYAWANKTVISRDIAFPLEGRDNWVCRWFSSCWQASKYCGTVTKGRINAVVAATRERLMANDGELMKRITDGYIASFAVGIVSGITSWFITEKFSIQNKDFKDACNTDAINARLDRIEANIRAMMELLRSDVTGQTPVCQEAKMERVSEETTKQLNGQELAHSMRFTRDKNDYKYVGGC